MLNTILCSAGRRVELIRLFKAAYKDLGLAGKVVALDIDRLAPALQAADQSYLVPRRIDAEFPDAFFKICAEVSPALAFPLIDPDIPMLAGLSGEMARRGVTLAGVQTSSLEATEDKWHTRALFQRLGLATPDSWLPADLPLKPHFPLFVKPRRGSAGKGAFKIASHSELTTLIEASVDPIVQEYIDAPEVTSDVVCDPQGTVLAIVSRQRIEVRNGEVQKAVTIRNRQIEDGCRLIALALDARGPITVQSFLTSRGPVFSEVNARLGGGFPLGVAAGADSLKWLLARAARLPIEIPPIGTYEAGVYMTRYDESFILRNLT